MEEVRWNIRSFTTDTGRKPVLEWIASLDEGAQAAVKESVLLLREYGVTLDMPHSRHLGQGLWELRARDSSGIYRVIYFHWRGRTLCLLHGFTKKTQRTPPADISLARQRMDTWLRRSSEGKRRNNQ